MDDIQLLIGLHKDGYRQYPGSDAATRLALTMTGIDPSSPIKVADIGCGTGASTLVSAAMLNADITAIDLLPEFFERHNGSIQCRKDRSGRKT